jgi:hypothetical protein
MNISNPKLKDLSDPKAYLKALEPGIDTEEHAITVFPFLAGDADPCTPAKDLKTVNKCTDEEILKEIAGEIEKAEKANAGKSAKEMKEAKISAAYFARMRNCADVLYELTKGTVGVKIIEKDKDPKTMSPYKLWEDAKDPITKMEAPRAALEKAEEKLRQLKEDADRSNKVIDKEKMDKIKDAEKEVEAAKKTFIAALDKAALAISLAQVADQALEQLVNKGEMRKAYTNWMKAHKQAKKGVGYCTERSAASFLPNMVVIKRSEKEEVSF